MIRELGTRAQLTERRFCFSPKNGTELKAAVALGPWRPEGMAATKVKFDDLSSTGQGSHWKVPGFVTTPMGFQGYSMLQILETFYGLRFSKPWTRSRLSIDQERLSTFNNDSGISIRDPKFLQGGGYRIHTRCCGKLQSRHVQKT